MAKKNKDNTIVEQQADNSVKSEKVIKESKKDKDNKKAKKNSNKKGVQQRSKELYSELKKVSWPSFGKVAKTTGVVLLVTVVCTLILFGADRLFYWLFGLLIG